ncbi:hypothetical protein LOS78_13570 [Paracoccus sp. MA]|uniref:hypothetical protein n=1 Tax=Paracoccus sp. MA TaxID=2895796 RepID=UPI001E45C41F|nr:hypothetical protein [Paracoccus sp. MA]UFM64704.1 hypothetical protein LOS78_13570 [Paracoccus sp. MA]
MLVDPQHPFFRPLWVRVLCVLLPLLWAGFEAASGSVFWAILFGAAGVYLFVTLFLNRSEDR